MKLVLYKSTHDIHSVSVSESFLFSLSVSESDRWYQALLCDWSGSCDNYDIRHNHAYQNLINFI